MLAATRTARQTLKTRSAATRFRASLNRGRAITTHLIAAGIDTDTAVGVASGLRSVAKRLHIAPVKVARTNRTVDGPCRARSVHHFTSRQVAALVAQYKPRKAEYKAAIAAYRLAA